MFTINNEFEHYNEKGFYPELRPFGTGLKTGQPHYELDLYIKGLDRSVCLRRGAPSKGETRLLALHRLADLTDIVMQYESFVTSREFWEGYDYINDFPTDKVTKPDFKAGMELRSKLKKITEKHYKV